MSSVDPAARARSAQLDHARGLDRPALLLLAFLALLTGARIAGLVAAPVDLHGDEAQYWVWSRSLDWGYFSKPPLVAWAIALTTSVFGDAEWAVRLAAPIAHAGGAFMLFLLGRRMYGVEAGLWAGLGWSLMPGVWVSSAVISTDALMLPAIALALYAAWRLMETRAIGFALLLGFAGGIGFLAKYGMTYFLVGLVLAALAVPALRRALASRLGLIAALTAGATIAPNLIWNALNDFATVSHTAANVNLASQLFNPDELGQFFADQLGVFGPLMFLALLGLFAAAALGRWRLGDREKFLIAFVLPPLAIIAVQALLSRAHANWAAAAYPAAMVLVSAALAQGRGRWALGASLALHGLFGAFLFAVVLSQPFAERIGAGDWLKRAKGWEETARTVAALDRVAETPYSAILTDHRMAYNALRYYLRDEPAADRLRMWRLYEHPGNEAEAAAPMSPEAGERVLVVGTVAPYAPVIAGDFAAFDRFAQSEIPLGGGAVRTLTFYEARDFSPAPRDEAFETLLARARAGEIAVE